MQPQVTSGGNQAEVLIVPRDSGRLKLHERSAAEQLWIFKPI